MNKHEYPNYDFPSAEVIGKDGTDGTVTFVVDDGDTATGRFTAEMMDKYPGLKFTYAIPTSKLATLITVADSASGKVRYVMSEDGKYTYTVNQARLDFWNSILANYNTEIVSHSHTHTFWGIDDEGGVQSYVASRGKNVMTSENLPVGSSTAEVYAPKQIIEELLGIRAISHTMPGIGVYGIDTVVEGITYKTYSTYYRFLLEKALAEGAIVSLMGNIMRAENSSLSKYVTRDNIKSCGGVARMFLSPHDDKSIWMDFIDAAADNDAWATYCIHTITPDVSPGHYILECDAEALFRYAHEKNVWIANYTEAALYYAEWASAKVKAEYNNGKITVTLTDDEDNTVYNQALTVKVSVPTSWEYVNVGNEVLKAKSDSNGNSYVCVNIVPDSGAVELSASATAKNSLPDNT